MTWVRWSGLPTSRALENAAATLAGVAFVLSLVNTQSLLMLVV